MLLNKNYEWSGLTATGQKMSGTLEAPTHNLARLTLSRQGITVLTLKKEPFILFAKTRDKITKQDITYFFRQLATLLHAGIPILQCMHLLISTQTKFSLQKLFSLMKSNIESGKSISHSLKQFPNYFDKLSFHMVQIGEHTGKLDSILLKIAAHKEKKQQLTKQFQQALLYPAIILCVALSVTLIMLIFVVPKFADIFSTISTPLPLFTRIVFSISFFICHDYEYLLGIFLILFFILFYLLKTERWHLIFDVLILKIPILGNITQKIIFSRFANGLATTLSAGISLAEGLSMIIPLLGNKTYQTSLTYLHQKVTAGLPLAEAMRQAAIFPEIMLQLTKIGEEAGKLEEMQAKVASIFEADINQFISQLGTLLEPLIITILGVLIGCVVIALYLPIFKLGMVI